ncbi:hypothetical protein [Duganella sp. S19_KUP01_CR8]
MRSDQQDFARMIASALAATPGASWKLLGLPRLRETKPLAPASM